MSVHSKSLLTKLRKAVCWLAVFTN